MEQMFSTNVWDATYYKQHIKNLKRLIKPVKSHWNMSFFTNTVWLQRGTRFHCWSLQLVVWRWISLKTWGACHHKLRVLLWSVPIFHVFDVRYSNYGAKHQPNRANIKLVDNASHIYFTMQCCVKVHNTSNVKSHPYKTPNHPRHQNSSPFACFFIISARRCKWKTRC